MSLLVQLRAGHVPLQAYLHRIGKMESPTCTKCRGGDETVEYYLTACKAFAAQQGCMERHLRGAAKSISTLLNNPKAFPNLFRFIQDMRRFQGTTRDI